MDYPVDYPYDKFHNRKVQVMSETKRSLDELHLPRSTLNKHSLLVKYPRGFVLCGGDLAPVEFSPQLEILAPSSYVANWHGSRFIHCSSTNLGVCAWAKGKTVNVINLESCEQNVLPDIPSSFSAIQVFSSRNGIVAVTEDYSVYYFLDNKWNIVRGTPTKPPISPFIVCDIEHEELGNCTVISAVFTETSRVVESEDVEPELKKKGRYPSGDKDMYVWMYYIPQKETRVLRVKNALTTLTPQGEAKLVIHPTGTFLAVVIFHSASPEMSTLRWISLPNKSSKSLPVESVVHWGTQALRCGKLVCDMHVDFLSLVKHPIPALVLWLRGGLFSAFPIVSTKSCTSSNMWTKLVEIEGGKEEDLLVQLYERDDGTSFVISRGRDIVRKVSTSWDVSFAYDSLEEVMNYCRNSVVSAEVVEVLGGAVNDVASSAVRVVMDFLEMLGGDVFGEYHQRKGVLDVNTMVRSIICACSKWVCGNSGAVVARRVVESFSVLLVNSIVKELMNRLRKKELGDIEEAFLRYGNGMYWQVDLCWDFFHVIEGESGISVDDAWAILANNIATLPKLSPRYLEMIRICRKRWESQSNLDEVKFFGKREKKVTGEECYRFGHEALLVEGNKEKATSLFKEGAMKGDDASLLAYASTLIQAYSDEKSKWNFIREVQQWLNLPLIKEENGEISWNLYVHAHLEKSQRARESVARLVRRGESWKPSERSLAAAVAAYIMDVDNSDTTCYVCPQWLVSTTIESSNKKGCPARLVWNNGLFQGERPLEWTPIRCNLPLVQRSLIVDLLLLAGEYESVLMWVMEKDVIEWMRLSVSELPALLIPSQQILMQTFKQAVANSNYKSCVSLISMSDACCWERLSLESRRICFDSLVSDITVNYLKKKSRELLSRELSGNCEVENSKFFELLETSLSCFCSEAKVSLSDNMKILQDQSVSYEFLPSSILLGISLLGSLQEDEIRGEFEEDKKNLIMWIWCCFVLNIVENSGTSSPDCILWTARMTEFRDVMPLVRTQSRVLELVDLFLKNAEKASTSVKRVVTEALYIAQLTKDVPVKIKDTREALLRKHNLDLDSFLSDDFHDLDKEVVIPQIERLLFRENSRTISEEVKLAFRETVVRKEWGLTTEVELDVDSVHFSEMSVGEVEERGGGVVVDDQRERSDVDFTETLEHEKLRIHSPEEKIIRELEVEELSEIGSLENGEIRQADLVDTDHNDHSSHQRGLRPDTKLMLLPREVPAVNIPKKRSLHLPKIKSSSKATKRLRLLKLHSSEQFTAKKEEEMTKKLRLIRVRGKMRENVEHIATQTGTEGVEQELLDMKGLLYELKNEFEETRKRTTRDSVGKTVSRECSAIDIPVRHGHLLDESEENDDDDVYVGRSFHSQPKDSPEKEEITDQRDESIGVSFHSPRKEEELVEIPPETSDNVVEEEEVQEDVKEEPSIEENECSVGDVSDDGNEFLDVESDTFREVPFDILTGTSGEGEMHFLNVVDVGVRRGLDAIDEEEYVEDVDERGEVGNVIDIVERRLRPLEDLVADIDDYDSEDDTYQYVPERKSPSRDVHESVDLNDGNAAFDEGRDTRSEATRMLDDMEKMMGGFYSNDTVSNQDIPRRDDERGLDVLPVRDGDEKLDEDAHVDGRVIYGSKKSQTLGQRRMKQRDEFASKRMEAALQLLHKSTGKYS